MASTIIIYEGDGTRTDFTIPFDYLKKSFVTVRLGTGNTLTGGDYGDTGSDYYFLDKTTIRLKVAPASGESLTIRRYTSATERVVTFKDASILKATDLDTSQMQAFHIAEEGRDILEDSLSVNREGNWDAKGKRIINVGAPVADNDAVTYGIYKADALGAHQSKIAAEKARDRAIEAETNSKESEANAKYYANKANEVLTQVATDVVNRVTAEGTKQVGLVSNQGTTSVNAVKAQQTASVNAVVTQQGTSVKAVQAQQTTSVNAVTAEGTEQVGLVSTEGTKQVDLAKAQVTLATQSASTATAKATIATQQATLATTKATNASNSAKAAKLSADNAALSKTAAGTSEVNAKASEVEAKKQADLAKQYADQAVAGQLQADWAQTNSTKVDFIKNKPTLGTLSAKNSLAYSELTGVPTSFTPSSHTHPISQVTNLQASLDAKTNDATLQVDLTAIRESITNVSSKVDGIGDTLSPTYAKKQGILDACDQAMNGANPVHAGDPTLDDIKSALATIQAQLGQLEGIKYVKETGKSSDGKSWYRKWSDGWLEQGGVKEKTILNGATSTITLPIAYKDASYSIRGIGVKRQGYYGYAVIEQNSVTKSSFAYAAMGNTSNDGVVKFHWYTCDYIG